MNQEKVRNSWVKYLNPLNLFKNSFLEILLIFSNVRNTEGVKRKINHNNELKNPFKLYLKLHTGTRLISDLGTHFAALLAGVSNSLSAAPLIKVMTIKTINAILL
jgi:hypothetical protein